MRLTESCHSQGGQSMNITFARWRLRELIERKILKDGLIHSSYYRAGKMSSRGRKWCDQGLTEVCIRAGNQTQAFWLPSSSFLWNQAASGNRMADWGVAGWGPPTANYVPVLLKFLGIWIKNWRMDSGRHSFPFGIRSSCHSGPFTPFGPSVREMLNDDT